MGAVEHTVGMRLLALLSSSSKVTVNTLLFALVRLPTRPVLAEFGDETARYADARAREYHAGTFPITRRSGKLTFVQARYRTTTA